MGNKKFLFISILILAVGFASVSTTLYISGKVAVSTKKSDFDVYFSGAELDGEDVSNIVIKDKKHIEYTSNELKTKDDTSVLKYEVTNDSTEYDATVTISCAPMKTEYVEVTLNPVIFDIDAGEIKTGEIEAKLLKVSETEQTVEIACDLDVKAKEKTSLVDKNTNTNTFSISGYLLNDEGLPVSNANLAVYSDTPHYVKTDLYGFFYVDGLERGMHEVYYLNSEEDKEYSKEELKTKAKASFDISTTNKKEFTLSNGYKIDKPNIKVNYKNKTYIVALNANDGELSETEVEVTENEKFPSLPIPTKTNYTFLGWYYGDKLVNENVTVDKDSIDELVARWDIQKYNVTFDPNGGSLNEEELSKLVAHGSTYGELPSPTRKDYIFDGWYLDLDGKTKVESTTEFPNTNITLYALWIYREEYVGESYPDLSTGLIPIVSRSNSTVANIRTDWYRYENDISANAVRFKNSYSAIQSSNQGATMGNGFLGFDGNDCVKLGLANVNFGNTVTLGISFRTRNVLNSVQQILNNLESAGATLYVNSDNSILFGFWASNYGNYIYLSGPKVTTYTEYTAIGIYDGTYAYLYINGQLYNQYRITDTIKSTSTSYVLGANPNGTSCINQFATVDLYQSVIFNRAISADEAKRCVNSISITNTNSLLSFLDFTNGDKYKAGDYIMPANIQQYYTWNKDSSSWQ